MYELKMYDLRAGWERVNTEFYKMKTEHRPDRQVNRKSLNRQSFLDIILQNHVMGSPFDDAGGRNERDFCILFKVRKIESPAAAHG